MLTRRGDTIIEVLLAITIFSGVAVATLALMNQGMAATQRSLEITKVRQEIDAQAAALRLIYSDAVAARSTSALSNESMLWGSVMNRRIVSATPDDQLTTADSHGNVSCSLPISTRRAFAINVKTGAIISNITQASTNSRVVYSEQAGNTSAISSEGLWIEAVQHNSPLGSTAPGYTDFYIRTCWVAVGQARPVTIGTIVRLYDAI